MGILNKVANFLLGTIKIAPVIAGAASPWIKRAPTGRTLVQDIKSGNIDNFLYDAKEIFTGVDANGRVQMNWLTGTYLPVFIGLGVSGAISAIMKEVKGV